jgi:hypothetical protein
MFAAKKGKLDEITPEMLTNYRIWLRNGENNDKCSFTKLCAFIRRWQDLGYLGVSDDVSRTINEFQFKHPPPAKAVQRNDPNSGPDKHDELASLEGSWMCAYAQGIISHEDYSLCLFLSRTGRRAEQLVQIKLKDFDHSKLADNMSGDTRPPQKLLLVDIPRVKQRDPQWRGSFRSVNLTIDLWNILIKQKMEVISRFENIINKADILFTNSDNNYVLNNMPLWPLWSSVEETVAKVSSLRNEFSYKVAINTFGAFLINQLGISRRFMFGK